MLGLVPSLKETEVELDDTGLCCIFLARPLRGNGYTSRMADELDWLFRTASSDDAVRVVVLAGRGKRFCVGADLDGRALGAGDGGGENRGPGRDIAGVAALSIGRCRKPVIAALHGACVGGGITILLPADMRIAEEDCKVAFPFSRRGLTVEGTASYFLPRIVGQSKALELCLTGRTFLARQEPSLFTEVVPTGRALERAKEIAADLIRNCSSISLSLIKASLTSNVSSPLEAHQMESSLLGSDVIIPEFIEGATSFLEKRDPQFPGRLNASDYAAIDQWTHARPLPPTRQSKL